jgi:hypothetical protein
MANTTVIHPSGFFPLTTSRKPGNFQSDMRHMKKCANLTKFSVPEKRNISGEGDTAPSHIASSLNHGPVPGDKTAIPYQ